MRVGVKEKEDEKGRNINQFRVDRRGITNQNETRRGGNHIYTYI